MDTMQITKDRPPAARPIAEANRDIFSRSLDLGVSVLRLPRPGDLSLVCEHFSSYSTVPAGQGILLEVDNITGKVGACTILSYEKGLFARDLRLWTHLHNYLDASTEDDEWEHGLRLFHATLAHASPAFSQVLQAAYAVADELESADAEEEAVYRARAGRGLQRLGAGALRAARSHLRDLIRSAEERKRLAAGWSLFNLAPPLAWAETAACAKDGSPNTALGKADTLGKPDLSLSWSERQSGGMRLTLGVNVRWEDGDLDPLRPVRVVLIVPDAPPPDLAWAGWIEGGSLVLEHGKADENLLVPLLDSPRPLSPEEMRLATGWAEALRLDIAQD